MKFLITISVILGALAWASPMRADECQTPERVRTDVLAVFPQASLATVAEQDLQFFLRSFNAEPPQTEAKADMVMLIQIKDVPTINVVFFVGNCVHGQGTINAEQLLRFLGSPA